MKPRVYCCMPSRSSAKIEAAYSHYVGMKHKDGCEIIPTISTSSLLCHSFNRHWAKALTWQKQGIIDYFFMHHDDIEALTPYFLDEMVKEMQAVGAAVLSVIQPLKNHIEVNEGKQPETSTAVETDKGPWMPRRLTFREVAELPETFTMPGLLINTGLMLVDIRRPEFHEKNGYELYFKFEIQNRIVQAKDGELHAQFRPEDWNFSRLCHSRNLPVYATRKIVCNHWGDMPFSNQPRMPQPVQVNNGQAETKEEGAEKKTDNHCGNNGTAIPDQLSAV